MIDEIMKRGKVECACGNTFSFQSIRKDISCIKCGKMHPNNGEPVPLEEPTEPEEEV